MKVLLVNGSPHQFGCTYTALQIMQNEFQKQNIESEIFWIGNKPIISCTACNKCKQIGKCIFEDSVNSFVRKAYYSNAFIFASPVHYAGTTGSLISFLGRVFHSNFSGQNGNAFKHKPASVVCTARRAGTTNAFDQLSKFFTISQMPIISSNYWNMLFGTTPQEILEDKEGINTLNILVENMAYFLSCIEIAKKNGLAPPK